MLIHDNIFINTTQIQKKIIMKKKKNKNKK